MFCSNLPNASNLSPLPAINNDYFLNKRKNGRDPTQNVLMVSHHVPACICMSSCVLVNVRAFLCTT